MLDAAATLFAGRGYHETGVPDIVRAAGVAHGTFYQYFEHRRDVLVALSQAAHASVSERPVIQTSNLRERLRTDINWYLAETLRHRTLAKVWHDAIVYDREIAEMTRDARTSQATLFAAMFRQTGSRVDLDPDLAGMAIVAMIEEVAYRHFVEDGGLGRRTGDTLAAAETLTALVMRSLNLADGNCDEDGGGT